ITKRSLYVLVLALMLAAGLPDIIAQPVSIAHAAQAKIWKVALVLPGSINDKGFNESAYNGLMLLKQKLGVEIAYSEATPTANFERVIRGFAEDGNDLIIGHGFEFGYVLMKLIKDYPS